MTVTTLRPIIPREGLVEDLIKLGGEDLIICYQCGSCTAICPLSEVYNISFRKSIKYAQLGLEDKILSDTIPWLCYACGECSDSCPRNAKPTNILASIRRYLTMKYDWTGLSKALYLSKKAEVLGIAVLSILTLIVIYLFHGPIVLGRVELETFAPIEIVEPAGILTLIVLGGVLLTNVYRMYRFVMSDTDPNIKIPFSVYFREFISIIPQHFLTQRLMNKCRSRKSYWVNHLLIFYGYSLSFFLFAIILRFTQTNEPFLFYNPLSLLGIFSFGFLLMGSLLAIYGRVRKTQPIWSFSHPTDWMFITLLLFVSLTGLLTGIFRAVNMPLATYITYSIHLMLVIPFLVLEVPFAKWSHLAYRPFALYFHRLKEYKSVFSQKYDEEVYPQPIEYIVSGGV